MRLRMMVWTAAASLALAAVAVAGAKAKPKADKPPQQMVIKSCQKKKPPVPFPHQAHVKHLDNDCRSCHHTGANTACGVTGCHAGKAQGKHSGCAEMSLTQNPFHINCITCHKKEGKGPKGCAQCHKKEKKGKKNRKRK